MKSSVYMVFLLALSKGAQRILFLVFVFLIGCTLNDRPAFRSGIPPYKSNKVFISHRLTDNGAYVMKADGNLVLLEKGKERAVCQFSPGLTHADVSHDSSLIATVYPGSLRTYRISDCKLLSSYSFSKRVTSAALSPLNDGMLMGGEEGYVYFWRFQTSDFDLLDISNIHQYPGHGNLVSSIAFHPGGKVFFSGDWNGDFLVWERYDADAHQGKYDEGLENFRFLIEKPERVQARQGEPDPIEHVLITNDGAYVLLFFDSGMLEFYSIRGLEQLWRMKVLDGLPRSVAMFQSSPHTLVVALLDRERQLQLLKVDSREEKAADAVEKINQSFVAGAAEVVFDEGGQLYVGKNDGSIEAIVSEGF